MAGVDKPQVWRSTFSSFRQATLRSSSVAASLVPGLLSQSHILVASTPHLPPKEVAKDMCELVRVVSLEFLMSDNCDGRNINVKVCHMISEICSRVQLELEPASLSLLLCYLRGLIKNSTNLLKGACKHNNDGEVNDDQDHITQEVLHTLGQLLHDIGGQISSSEVTITMDLLLQLVLCQDLIKSPTSQNGKNKSNITWDCQRLLFVVIGNLLTRSGSVMVDKSWHALIKVLRAVLEAMVLGAQLIENTVASRFYAAVLHCVHLAFLDTKGSLTEHVPAFVPALCKFLNYGLIHNTAVNQVLQCRKEGQARAPYRPPHLRHQWKDNRNPVSLNENQTTNNPRRSLGTREAFLSSDSEFSDSDGSVGDVDRFKSSKARMAAISGIQVLARADPKSLHAHWMLLLPTYDILSPRGYHSSLMNTLLFDPVLKVRLASASTILVLLEAPSHSFLQVAEYKESGRSGSFTTLSSSLGQIIIQLQTGFVHVIVNETHSGLLTTSLKALSSLVSAAPFGRLPDGLLPNIISRVHRKAKDLFMMPNDHYGPLCAALACLTTALNRAPASHQVAAMLSVNDGGSQSSAGNHSLLSDLMDFACPPVSSNIRIEALQALRAAVHTYPAVLLLRWEAISALVWGAIQNSKASKMLSTESMPNIPHGFGKNGSLDDGLGSTDEKALHCAVKLLDEFLRAASNFSSIGNLDDEGLVQSPSPEVLPTPLKILPCSSSNVFPTQAVDTRKRFDVAGRMQWVESLQKHLPPVLLHSIPMVRGASLTCFAGLTAAVFSSLSETEQRYILEAVMNAALHDEAPSVQSSACRVIGIVVSFSEVFERDDRLAALVNAVVLSTLHTSITVRITASWALGNICNVFRNNVEVKNKNASKSVSTLALAECALKLTKDSDKVRANAVRAIGNLARFLKFSDDTIQNQSHDKNGESGERLSVSYLILQRIVQSLVSCVTTGNVKVRWNVCHALGNLFLNPSISLSEMSWAASVYSILLLLLRDSTNLKIRIHAASALVVPSARQDYQDSFADIVHALVQALESIDSNQPIGPSGFKYIDALREQLTTTCLHILGLLDSTDYNCLGDFLVKRSAFFEGWLKSAYDATLIADDEKCESSNIVLSDASVKSTDIFLESEVKKSLLSSSGDKRLLPLPKERIWFELDGEDALFCKKESFSERRASIVNATQAMYSLYLSSDKSTLVKIYEKLLAQFNKEACS